ncbi:site-2 protease family protein [Paenibacillus sp. GCM10012307]|uniref:Site-2 protease family protein n=1 Tax=Paenibacillus roseus TaxID=2798579 RepID=A0A934J7L0_9BACL|nr:site-2 protease family protein [Paenibacillus roseus]MBJ6363093.1 site-2 protease family protein [Paenibacillus roseus]
MEFLEKLTWYPLADLPFIVLVLMIAFSVHEFAHAYAAYKFGDMTAYNQGRVTLDPRSHLDIVGTLLILIAGFGWARPVPVNRGHFKHPRIMGIIVSAAGPLSNLLLAVIGILIVYVLNQAEWLYTDHAGVTKAVIHFLYYLILMNTMLFLFNLIPLPPLDGYRIIQDMLPQRQRIRLEQHEQWGMFIFLLIVFIPQLRMYTLDPLFSLSVPIRAFIQSLMELVFAPVDWKRFVIAFLR